MGTTFNDPFSGVDISTLETIEQKPTPAAEKTPTPESTPREIKPAAASGATGAAGDVSPIDPDEIFSFAEGKFLEMSKNRDADAPANPGRIATSQEEKTLNTKEVMSPEMIEISAAMYVQILESVWSGICEWFSGVGGEYNFDRKMKERYEKITSMYFEAQNVRLTPTHFFALMTVFVLFGSGWKAYGDRKRRIKAESFKKKVDARNQKRNTGEQATLFDSEPIARGRLYYAAERDEDGKVWYTKHPTTGTYAKRLEREQVPPELQDFIIDFKANNKAWPTKKQVDTFLTQP